jgi:hypothetical protein
LAGDVSIPYAGPEEEQRRGEEKRGGVEEVSNGLVEEIERERGRKYDNSR